MAEENVTLQGVLQEIEGLLVKLLAASANDDCVVQVLGEAGRSEAGVSLSKSEELLETEPRNAESYVLGTISTQIKDSGLLETDQADTEDLDGQRSSGAASSSAVRPPSILVPSVPSMEDLHRRSLRSHNLPEEQLTSQRYSKHSTQSLGAEASPMGRQVSFMPEDIGDLLDSREESHSLDVNFEMHPGWRSLGDRPSTSHSRRRPSQFNFAAVVPLAEDITIVLDRKQRTKILPVLRLIWACVTGLMIIFDVATIPLMVFGNQGMWVGEMIFWMLNLPVRLLLLFYFKGQPWGICFAALEVPLMAVMLFEWMDRTSSPMWQGLYMLRILQVPRLYGITGFARFVRRWFHSSSREVRGVVNILAAMLVGLLFLHVLTCAWFAVDSATSQEMTSPSLVTDHYWRSLELALSRLHPSRTFENMQLGTQPERLLAVLATGLALLGGSIFTSIVTNDLSDIRRVRRMQKEAEYQVSDFFMIYPVSWELELQVKDHLHNNMSRVAPPCKQEMNAMLPNFLYRELCREALAPLLQKHSLLYDITKHHLSFQYELCVDCLVDWNLGSHEMLFSRGPKCEQMLILCSGEIIYAKESLDDSRSVSTSMSVVKAPSSKLRRGQSSLGSGFDKKLKDSGDWLCEASLWCPWNYVGRAQSVTRAALLCLNYHKLLAAAGRDKEACRELVVYARHFMQELQKVPEEQLTDLPFGFSGS